MTSLLLTASLAGCGVAGAGDDGRKSAIQTLFSTKEKQPTAGVSFGHVCAYNSGGVSRDPAAYAHIPGAHVVSDGLEKGFGTNATSRRCYKVTWDPSVGVKAMSLCGMCSTYMAAPIGRYLVDKVGDDQTAFGTMKITPYKAHFEPDDLGKALIAAGIAKAPKDISDGQAMLHKDADGKWVAQ